MIGGIILIILPVKTRQCLVYMNFSPEQQTVERFFEAVQTSSNDVWSYVSRVYSPRLDLDELREILSMDITFAKWVSKATYLNDPKNCLTRSLYIEAAQRTVRRLLHVRMIKQPDRNGTWKIYGVEQEECAKV